MVRGRTVSRLSESEAWSGSRSYRFQPSSAKLLIGFEVGTLCPFVPGIYKNRTFAVPASLMNNCRAQPTAEISGSRTIEYVRMLTTAGGIIPACHHPFVPSLCRRGIESFNGSCGSVTIVIDAAQFSGQVCWAWGGNFTLRHVRRKFKVGVEPQYLRIIGRLAVSREGCPRPGQVNIGNPLLAKCRSKSTGSHGPLRDVSNTIDQ